MRTRRGAVMAAVGLAVTMLGGPVAAQSGGEPGDPVELPPLEVEPSSGPPGTSVEVRGAGCVPAEDLISLVLVSFVDTTAPAPPVQRDATGDAEGAWSVVFEVPLAAPPDHEYVIEAHCTIGREIHEFEPVPFDVTPAPSPPTTPQPVPTTPPSPAPTVSPAAPSPVAPRAAAPAIPVVAAPTYTG